MLDVFSLPWQTSGTLKAQEQKLFKSVSQVTFCELYVQESLNSIIVTIRDKKDVLMSLYLPRTVSPPWTTQIRWKMPCISPYPIRELVMTSVSNNLLRPTSLARILGSPFSWGPPFQKISKILHFSNCSLPSIRRGISVCKQCIEKLDPFFKISPMIPTVEFLGGRIRCSAWRTERIPVLWYCMDDTQ